MSSLRATAARTRVIRIKTISPSIRRPITTSEPDRKKRPNAPHAPSTRASGWSEDLATASEAFVKADRDTATIDEMQQRTVDYVQSHRPDPEVEQTHATYARDEVGGPLGAAGMGEFEGVVGNDDLGPDDVQVESNGRVVTRRVMREKTTVHEGEGQANVSHDHVGNIPL